VLAFVFTPTTSFTERQLAIAACDVLGGGGLPHPLKKNHTKSKKKGTTFWLFALSGTVWYISCV
jgi:hypothetical protein